MKPKLLYLITEDWFFCSHFIARAVAAKNAGWDVAVITNVNQHADAIRAAGIRLLPLQFNRRGTNPLYEFNTFRKICAIYKSERPHLVHHIAIKPILYGSLAAKLCGIKRIVNAPVGMGYIFISQSLKARLLRIPVAAALHCLFNPKGSKVIFENKDDLKNLTTEGCVSANDALLIRGAGIDLNTFHPVPEPSGVPKVVLTARMLWDKGIKEFVEAARSIHAQGIPAQFVLAGSPDPLNPASIDEDTLRAWNDEGVVRWVGHQTDVASLLASSHIVCLPSYREGLPKSLLEALASGRPIVATDVPGCRELAVSGQTGLLVPPRDAGALAQALIELLKSPQKRLTMGQAGRKYAEQEFSEETIIAETLAVYTQLSEAI